MLTQIVKADYKTFRKYRSQVMDIYMEACTTGVMEQYLDRATETAEFERMFQNGGYGYIALSDGKVIGSVFAASLIHDSLLPETITRKFHVDRCLKVSEMHVHKDYRGRGVGSELLQRLIEEADRDRWDYLFIRAWKNNTRAINLYKRFGFKPGEIIHQTKVRKDRSGTFDCEKQYLWQKL